MPPRSLNALDEQIAALKRKLREAAAGSDDARRAPRATRAARTRGVLIPRVRTRSGSGGGESASSSSSADSRDAEELPPIVPLPPQALPEYYTKEAAKARGEAPAEPPPLRRPPKPEAGGDEAKPRRKKRRAAGDGVAPAAAEEGAAAGEGAARPRCALCKLLFTSDAQLAEHLQARPPAAPCAEAPGGADACARFRAGEEARAERACAEAGAAGAAACAQVATGRQPRAAGARMRRCEAAGQHGLCRKPLPTRFRFRAGARVRAVPQAVHQRGAVGGAQAGQVAPDAPARRAAPRKVVRARDRLRSARHWRADLAYGFCVKPSHTIKHACSVHARAPASQAHVSELSQSQRQSCRREQALHCSAGARSRGHAL